METRRETLQQRPRLGSSHAIAWCLFEHRSKVCPSSHAELRRTEGWWAGWYFSPQPAEICCITRRMLMRRFKATRYLLTECQTERGKQAITLSKFASHYVPRPFAPWAMNKNPVNKHDGENHAGGETEGKMRGERQACLHLKVPLLLHLSYNVCFIYSSYADSL